jgi:hypothetical protein
VTLRCELRCKKKYELVKLISSLFRYSMAGAVAGQTAMQATMQERLLARRPSITGAFFEIVWRISLIRMLGAVAGQDGWYDRGATVSSKVLIPVQPSRALELCHMWNVDTK